jgi:hypothetical protein
MMVLTLGDVESELVDAGIAFTGRNPSSTIAIDMGLPSASRILDGGSNPMTDRSLELTCGGFALSLDCASAPSDGTWLASSSSLSALDVSLDALVLFAKPAFAEVRPERGLT